NTPAAARARATMDLFILNLQGARVVGNTAGTTVPGWQPSKHVACHAAPQRNIQYKSYVYTKHLARNRADSGWIVKNFDSIFDVTNSRYANKNPLLFSCRVMLAYIPRCWRPSDMAGEVRIFWMRWWPAGSVEEIQRRL